MRPEALQVAGQFTRAAWPLAFPGGAVPRAALTPGLGRGGPDDAVRRVDWPGPRPLKVSDWGLSRGPAWGAGPLFPPLSPPGTRPSTRPPAPPGWLGRPNRFPVGLPRRSGGPGSPLPSFWGGRSSCPVRALGGAGQISDSSRWGKAGAEPVGGRDRPAGKGARPRRRPNLHYLTLTLLLLKQGSTKSTAETYFFVRLDRRVPRRPAEFSGPRVDVPRRAPARPAAHRGPRYTGGHGSPQVRRGGRGPKWTGRSHGRGAPLRGQSIAFLFGWPSVTTSATGSLRRPGPRAAPADCQGGPARCGAALGRGSVARPLAGLAEHPDRWTGWGRPVQPCLV